MVSSPSSFQTFIQGKSWSGKSYSERDSQPWPPSLNWFNVTPTLKRYFPISCCCSREGKIISRSCLQETREWSKGKICSQTRSSGGRLCYEEKGIPSSRGKRGITFLERQETTDVMQEQKRGASCILLWSNTGMNAYYSCRRRFKEDIFIQRDTHPEEEWGDRLRGGRRSWDEDACERDHRLICFPSLILLPFDDGNASLWSLVFWRFFLSRHLLHHLVSDASFPSWLLLNFFLYLAPFFLAFLLSRKWLSSFTTRHHQYTCLTCDTVYSVSLLVMQSSCYKFCLTPENCKRDSSNLKGILKEKSYFSSYKPLLGILLR